ncbi:MAG: type II secretion system protein GspG [Kiritimatiellia bacterium]|jgi:hypothetical protein
MWAGVLAGVLVVAFLLFSATTIIPPKDLTRTRFRALEVRIRHSLAQGQDVNSLDIKTLPEAPGKDNATTDGWGHPIVMRVDGSIITLTSYGKDGKPGGTDQDADIEHRFSIGHRKQLE